MGNKLGLVMYGKIGKLLNYQILTKDRQRLDDYGDTSEKELLTSQAL